jgi:glycosyltransferase involved in cell wall biosynthesis
MLEMKKNKKTNFLFISLSPVGVGLSGGDRIFIELARGLHKKNIPVHMVTWSGGVEMCKRINVSEREVTFKIISLGIFEKSGFLVNYIAKIIYGIFWALFYNLKKDFPDLNSVYLYSASEFWMDSLPGFILKMKYKKITWITTWFQTAPNPIRGFAEGKRESTYRFKAFLYWFSQLPIKPIFSRYADFICVNNENERKQFSSLNKRNKIFVFIGAIDLTTVKKWIKKNPTVTKKYEGIYHGRFHAQKGVGELIDIWNKVVDKLPTAQLVMIGDGPLRAEVEEKIKKNKLAKNVTLKGFMFDGDEKYKIFAQSKVVLHPALYDSGGMASAEVMAFGAPCIGFNLKAYESYYPKGMMKVQINNFDAFAKAIVTLLNDRKKYNEMKMDAIALIENNWTWDDRVRDFLKLVVKK